MIGIKEFKFKPQPLLSKCHYVECTPSDGSKIITWKYTARLEQAILEQEDYKQIRFLDENEKEIIIDSEQLKKYDYVKEQRSTIKKKSPTKEKKITTTKTKIPDSTNPYPDSLRFCKIHIGTKKPFQRNWTNLPYTWEEIQEHITKETNYGVLCGKGGLIVIDCDTKELEQAVKEKLPQTYIVQTGSGGKHYYYFCPEQDKKFVLQIDDKHFGEVQSTGTQVVGVGSVHPNGNIYKAIGKTAIATITKEDLLLTTKPFMNQVHQEEKRILEINKQYEETDIDKIPITSVINLTGFKRASNGELYGSNPWHGSTGGMNFWVNETKNVAHCFRCNCGINIFQAIGLNEGIILNCSDKLTKQDFSNILAIARKKHGLEEPNKVFNPLTTTELKKILEQTIKFDDSNKLITFLAMLTAYTEDSQLNISNNAPSSTGKSYIPTEICKLFPKHDVITVGYCSPTAFFHDQGTWDSERKKQIVDLSKKILVFLDQPHNLLLQHLRPILSHDKKEIKLKVTDKSQKHGLKTKNITIRGYPVVIFCTAGLNIDEQESTRFILLSPETTNEKIKLGIMEKIKKDSNPDKYFSDLNNNPERQLLKKRISQIKFENVQTIKLSQSIIEELEKYFFNSDIILKPRHQRDIGKIISFIKAFALLNMWFEGRYSENKVVAANLTDFKQAIELWKSVAKSQELSLPPYVFKLYEEVFLPAFKKGENVGLSRQNIAHAYNSIYGRPIQDWLLRQEILPMLESSGLIKSEQDKHDKRKLLYLPHPATHYTLKETVVSSGVGLKDKFIFDTIPLVESEKIEKNNIIHPTPSLTTSYQNHPKSSIFNELSPEEDKKNRQDFYKKEKYKDYSDMMKKMYGLDKK